ncbi:MAG TPA: N-6 DNA methylase [Methylocella sp.]|nr:N-6 DNA methylase [Methylocella sp.]
MARKRTRSAPALSFDALTVEGALISPAMLARIAAHQADEQTEADYGVPKGLTLRDEIARYFRIGQALLASLAASETPSHAATVKFGEELLRDVLGFADLKRAGVRTLGERQFAVTLEGLSGRVPIVIVPPSDELDRPSEHLPTDSRRRSAASAIQDLLNASEECRWGLCSNGFRLRLVRDNQSLTRPAFIEADLRTIFEEENFADFTALWLLLHASRFGRPGTPPADCALERWREAGLKEGVAARDRLRDGVEAALLSFGNGFLAHPDNGPLREKLHSDELPLSDYFGQLLRLVYRLIFLLAAEDRDLLHPPGTSAAARKLYAQGYSLASLREAAVRRAAWDRHHDRWEGLKITFAALMRGERRLGLPALDGLFAPGTLPDLENTRLANRALMEAVFRLAWLKDDSGLVPVNWRDMETEELGSVYESLLELTPQLNGGGRQFQFAEGGEAKGHARKTTGSYYTPDSLVQALLDSALNPVLDRVEAEANDPAAALLSVTVLDPACGSGHFLLAAARRIATRLAQARTQGLASPADYRHALRDVVRTCIHSVDRNPMAVELTKVALWIETVEPGKPLGFLDANIRCGDSLLGVFDLKALEQGIPDAAYKPLSGDDRAVARHYAQKNRREKAERERIAKGFGFNRQRDLMRDFAELRKMPEDTPEEIAAKAARLKALTARGAAGWTLARACDLYVAAFLAPKVVHPQTAGPDGLPRRGAETVPTSGTIWELLRGVQPYGLLVQEVERALAGARPFHWPLEFPDVMAAGGFDVVLGNPPWERIKLQEQEFFAARDPEIARAPNAAARGKLIGKLKEAEPGTRERALYEEFEAAKRAAEASSAFARVEAEDGGRFPLTGRGDVNTYALFAELFASLASGRGRAGVIVPAGLITDYNSSFFFRSLVAERRIIRSLAFDNQKRIFPAVHPDTPFTLLTMGRTHDDPEFASYLLEREHLDDPERRYRLSANDIARINPNTKTAPVFRSRADAELTAKIYARVPVLIDESKGKDGNPWGVSFMAMFHMSNDSGLFRTAAQLAKAGFVRQGSDWVKRQSAIGNRMEAVRLPTADSRLPAAEAERYVPLYEAKMIHQFDHRWATYAGGGDYSGPDDDNADGGKPSGSRDATLTEKQDATFEPTPRYFVPEREVFDRLSAKGWTRGWLMGWRDITNATNERTVIAAAFPRVGCGDTLLLMFPKIEQLGPNACLVGNLCSLIQDYAARQKIGGTHLKYNMFKQLPILPPSTYTESDLAFIVPRVLELTYTSRSMEQFARDLGYDGPPFKWDEDRRALLRAELDAWYARAYGLTRDELRYILDPADVKGPDYPSETFRILKTNDLKRFGPEDSEASVRAGEATVGMGTYYTARLVLQAWDRMERGEITEISPPITVTAPATAPSIASIDTTGLPDGAWATPAGGNVRDKTLAQIAAVLKALPGPTPVALARRAALYALEPRLLTARLQGAERAEWLRLVGAEAAPRDGVATLGLGGATGWGEAVRLLAATGCLVEDAAAQTWAPGAGLDAYFTDSWPQRAGFALQQAARILADESAAPPTAEEEEGLTALAA